MCASYTSAGIVYVDATEGEGGNTMLAMGEVFYVHGRWQRQWQPLAWKPGRYFDGMIDEVGIYDRALSDAEVAFLAQ